MSLSGSLGAVSYTTITRKITRLDTIPTLIAKVFNNEAFTIYPNPVAKNGNINISIKEAGSYEIQVLDNSSRLLYHGEYNTAVSKEAVNLPNIPNLAGGIYYIRMINTATRKQWVDKLMVQ